MKRVLAAVVGLSVAVGGADVARAVNSPIVVAAPVAGVAGTDFLIYDQIGPNLVVNNALNTVGGLNTLLLGNAASPTGNIELFADSEIGGYTLPLFQTHASIALGGAAAGHTVTLRSLNGADWFGAVPDYTYGAPNLANAWFETFMTTYGSAPAVSALVSASKPALYAQFLAAGGFQRLSDPNIGYVYHDSGVNAFRIGLEGSDDYIHGVIALYLTSVGHPELIAEIPPNVRASEVVGVSIDGGPTQFLYSFSGTSSGLTTTDGTESYTTNFELLAAVPEPASLGLLAVGATALMARRRRR